MKKAKIRRVKKPKVTLVKKPVLCIFRHAFSQQKIVYILIANKPLRYKWRRKSRIVYIGTTKKGAARIGQSAVVRGEKALGQHGIKQIDALVVKCQPRKRVEVWKKLESALLLTFKSLYGDVPRLNKQYRDRPVTDEYKLFYRERLEDILLKFDR